MRDYFLPAIPNECLLDQFAYKITESTTSALICLTDTVGRLLESNRYVHCVIINFSKVFDTVNHEILLKKITTVFNPWQYIELDCFFSDRSQATRVG